MATSETSKPIAAAASGAAQSAVLSLARMERLKAADESNDLALLTLLLWVFFLCIGVLGFSLQYERPVAGTPPVEPIVAEQLQVDLAPEPLDQAPLIPPTSEPPELPDEPGPIAVMEAIAVAQPSPALAFALPVEGPTRVVDAKRAAYVAPATTARIVTAPSDVSPPVQQLTFGQGEGKQVAPEYPPAARRLGQEGTVLVRISVGQDGRVLKAEAKLPSPWPLLNEASVRIVRERWRFHPGPARLYEVAIRFEIVK